jgi:hypothetical protein
MGGKARGKTLERRVRLQDKGRHGWNNEGEVDRRQERRDEKEELGSGLRNGVGQERKGRVD